MIRYAHKRDANEVLLPRAKALPAYPVWCATPHLEDAGPLAQVDTPALFSLALSGRTGRGMEDV
jgi:hypothetical protein